MKTKEEREIILNQLKKTPIVQIACDKTGISRTTYYRWRQNNKKFKSDSDKAIINGKTMINDMAESQLINAIKDKNFQAIKFWLVTHHIDYKNKVGVTHKDNNKPLTKSQKDLIKQALKFTQNVPDKNIIKNNTKEKNEN